MDHELKTEDTKLLLRCETCSSEVTAPSHAMPKDIEEETVCCDLPDYFILKEFKLVRKEDAEEAIESAKDNGFKEGVALARSIIKMSEEERDSLREEIEQKESDKSDTNGEHSD